MGPTHAAQQVWFFPKSLPSAFGHTATGHGGGRISQEDKSQDTHNKTHRITHADLTNMISNMSHLITTHTHKPAR